MKKLTQAEVKSLADEAAKLDAKLHKALDARDAEKAPLFDQINEIDARHNAKLLELTAKRDDKAKQVIAWLESQAKPITLATDLAVAANEYKLGSRTISAKKFFDAVADRTAEFFDCLKVEIGKADKFLGKTRVDELADKPKKLVASLTYK